MPSVPEPRGTRVPKPNLYEGRWRWWYSAISDWLIENPGGLLQDCAAKLNRNQSTISQIMNTDMFRDFHAQRLEKWRETHDFAIANKLTAVAEQGLDLILGVMKEKQKQIPLRSLVELTSSSLEKLGYGPKNSPGVVINAPTQNNSNTTIYAPISPAQLAEARDALRTAEQRRALAPPPTLTLAPIGQSEVGADQLLEEGGSSAPPTHDA